MMHRNFTKEQYSQLLNLIEKQNSDALSTPQQPSDQSLHTAFLVGTICLLSHIDNDWIIDSGATDHFCSNLQMFHTYKNIENQHTFITIPNGKKIQVTHIGNISLTKNLQLKDVLYVPDFQFNLISVHKLCQNLNCKITFNNQNCFLLGPTLPKKIVLGKLKSGLYYAKEDLSSDSQQSTSPIPSAGNVTSSSNIYTQQAKLWHLRLGHLPFSKLSHVLPFFKNKPKYIDTICQICPASKQCRLSFPTSEIKSTKPFHLLHIDVWGPYKHATPSNCNFSSL